MATSNQIHQIISPYPMGDVEKYFVRLDRLIGTNSGMKDYNMVTHNCYATSTPFGAHTNTKFRLTDQQFDIVDISQGYLSLKIKFDLEFKHVATNIPMLATYPANSTCFFVGFKSGAQIIDSYSVYSNGRLTSCKQVKAVEEQTIVFNCKSNTRNHFTISNGRC